MERPILTLDLLGPEGNVFVVIPRARSLLSGEELKNFNRELGMATLLDASKKYRDILEIVNHYVRLVDKSGLFSEYAINQEAIIAAIEHFNEQLQTLPVDIPCSLEDLYPDFADPDTDAYAYMALLMMDIASVEKQIEEASEGETEQLKRLLAMLQECVSALRRAGIE